MSFPSWPPWPRGSPKSSCRWRRRGPGRRGAGLPPRSRRPPPLPRAGRRDQVGASLGLSSGWGSSSTGSRAKGGTLPEPAEGYFPKGVETFPAGVSRRSDPGAAPRRRAGGAPAPSRSPGRLARPRRLRIAPFEPIVRDGEALDDGSFSSTARRRSSADTATCSSTSGRSVTSCAVPAIRTITPSSATTCPRESRRDRPVGLIARSLNPYGSYVSTRSARFRRPGRGLPVHAGQERLVAQLGFPRLDAVDPVQLGGPGDPVTAHVPFPAADVGDPLSLGEPVSLAAAPSVCRTASRADRSARRACGGRRSASRRLLRRDFAQ